MRRFSTARTLVSRDLYHNYASIIKLFPRLSSREICTALQGRPLDKPIERNLIPTEPAAGAPRRTEPGPLMPASGLCSFISGLFEQIRAFQTTNTLSWNHAPLKYHFLTSSGLHDYAHNAAYSVFCRIYIQLRQNDNIYHHAVVRI